MGFCKIFLVQTLLMQASSFVTIKPLKVDFRKAATDDYLSFIANSGPFVSTAYVKPRQLGANGGDYLSSIGMGGLVAPASMPAVKAVVKPVHAAGMPAAKPADAGMPAVKPADAGMPAAKPADAGMPAVKPVGAGADYLSTIASYQEKSALNMPTMDYVNKELKLAQNVLFDALGNITEEFVLKTVSLLRND
tara:strand:- start:395 stop:970 length:576 start_codon:yes stop_codon:yes gene_type:complete